MDLQDHRMACLRMAFELQGKHEHILKAANDFHAFVTTGELPAPAPMVLVASPQEAIAAETAEDAIAHCGTALEMPESGDLADAELPAVEATPAEAPAVEAAAEDAVATPDETPPTAHADGAVADETLPTAHDEGAVIG